MPAIDQVSTEYDFHAIALRLPPEEAVAAALAAATIRRHRLKQIAAG